MLSLTLNCLPPLVTLEQSRPLYQRRQRNPGGPALLESVPLGGPGAGGGQPSGLPKAIKWSSRVEEGSVA